MKMMKLLLLYRVIKENHLKHLKKWFANIIKILKLKIQIQY